MKVNINITSQFLTTGTCEDSFRNETVKVSKRRNDTLDPEHSDDGCDETRWRHVEYEEPAPVSAVLSGSEGGTGSVNHS